MAAQNSTLSLSTSFASVRKLYSRLWLEKVCSCYSVLFFVLWLVLEKSLNYVFAPLCHECRNILITLSLSLHFWTLILGTGYLNLSFTTPTPDIHYTQASVTHMPHTTFPRHSRIHTDLTHASKCLSICTCNLRISYITSSYKSQQLHNIKPGTDVITRVTQFIIEFSLEFILSYFLASYTGTHAHTLPCIPKYNIRTPTL